jgi:glycosyltransferase involved in cell wall biosynthesis
MTHSRQEQDTVATYVGIWHRLQELRHLLDTTKKPLKEWSSSLSSSSSLQQQQELVSIFHTNETARRLVSLIMTIQPIGVVEQAIHLYGSANNDGDTMQTFIHELISLWPRIMDFPPVPAGLSFEFELSVIVPAYREDGRELAYKLDSLIQNASSPIDIEIIVLDAGFCTHMDALQEQLRQQNCTEQQHPSCQITFYQYVNGGGRGPCLNYGAKLAKGRILTFLHADTRLVSTQDESWDMAIRNTFVMEDNTPTPSVTTTCCAFSFAIDQSPRALLGFGNRRASQDNHRIRSGTSSSSLYYHPPGLRAVQVTANFRSRFFQLPYGDQCLSMPSHIYHFIGGFPNQCLMEDYELVKLLRQRSMMIHSTRIFKQPFLSRGDEQLKILNLKAYCSPRRWQSYGVLYVTYTNSRLVRLYNKKNNDRKPSSSRNQTNDRLSPDDLFCQYYGTAHQKYKDRMGGKPKGE